MDQERYDGLYAEFVDCLMNAAVEEGAGGSRKDIRDRKAKGFMKEQAYLWLLSHEFAAFFSNGIGLTKDAMKSTVIDELAELAGVELADYLVALKAQDNLPLVALPTHPGKTALSGLIEDAKTGHEIYRDTAVLLRMAQKDPEVREFVYSPAKPTT